MTALQRFGFKTRKDGSEVYRDAEKVNQLFTPLSAEVGLVLSSCAGGAEVSIISSNRASQPRTPQRTIHFRLACGSNKTFEKKQRRFQL